jgi:hypothetical protein
MVPPAEVMKRVRLEACNARILCVTGLSAQQVVPANFESLLGLWKVRKWFGHYIRGFLAIKKRRYFGSRGPLSG